VVRGHSSKLLETSTTLVVTLIGLIEGTGWIGAERIHRCPNLSCALRERQNETRRTSELSSWGKYTDP
jgi:hypothetical protein